MGSGAATGQCCRNYNFFHFCSCGLIFYDGHRSHPSAAAALDLDGKCRHRKAKGLGYQIKVGQAFHVAVFNLGPHPMRFQESLGPGPGTHDVKGLIPSSRNQSPQPLCLGQAASGWIRPPGRRPCPRNLSQGNAWFRRCVSGRYPWG